MGRAYAGILGSLALTTVIARGCLTGAGFEGTLLAGVVALFVFALLGAIVGQLADFFVGESVRRQFSAAMADWEKQQTTDK